MFVPRALRLKGVKDTQKRKPEKPRATDRAEASGEDALVHAMQKTSTNSAATSPAPQDEKLGDKPTVSQSSKPGTTPASPEYLAQLVAGIELIFTDYAHQDRDGAKWLQERYRTVDGEEKYVHLTAVLDHPNIATLKPQATQSLLRQALKEVPSQTLELSNNGFYVRRRPSTYPASFVPANSFEVVNDDGLSFWDQRTIYVEPHIRHMCKTPAKVAHWLKEHGQFRPKWLPVQAVHTLYNSCAFVVLSGNVMHEDQWKKWRATEKPEDWEVMTKVENLKRTEEYIALLKASRAEVASKRKAGRDTLAEDDISGAQSGRSTHAMDTGEQSVPQKKRKRGQTATSAAVDEAGTETGVATALEGEDQTSKRRA